MDVNALSQKGFCGFVKMRFYVKSSCFRGGSLVLTLSTRIYTWLFENRQPARNASMAGRICVCYPMRFSNLKYSFRYGSDNSLVAGSLCRSQKNSTAENPHLFM